jgi:hypothetical protein
MEVVIRLTEHPSASSPCILGHFRFASGVSFVIAKELFHVVKVVMEVDAIWIIDASFGAFPRITQSHEQRKVVVFTGEEITAAFPGVSAVVCNIQISIPWPTKRPKRSLPPVRTSFLIFYLSNF